MSLGQNRARPSCTARARLMATRAWPVFTALARPASAAHSHAGVRPNSASAGAARAAQLGRPVWCTARARGTRTVAQCAVAALHGCLTVVPHRRPGDGRGKRGVAHRSVDDDAARRRRRRRRVARRAWTSAPRQRATGTCERVSAVGGARYGGRDALTGAAV
jgi:hypothetical protein